MQASIHGSQNYYLPYLNFYLGKHQLYHQAVCVSASGVAVRAQCIVGSPGKVQRTENEYNMLAHATNVLSNSVHVTISRHIVIAN